MLEIFILMRMRLFIVFVILMNAYLLFGQTDNLEIKAFVETLEGKPISNAVIEIYIGSNKTKSARTDAKGQFRLNLDYGNSYTIIISKSGMIQKRVDFIADIPAEKQRRLVKEFGVTLVEDCEGANTSVFKEPVDIVKFDDGFGNFVSDLAYVEKMQGKMATAYASLEKCKKDGYQKNRKEGDRAFKEKNYEEAEKLYKQALTYSPNDGYAKRQLSQVRKNVEKENNNQVLFDKLVAEGEQYLAKNLLTASQQRYREAAKLNPQDVKVKEKLQEIGQIIAQQQQQKQQEQALNNQYNSVMNKANNAMAEQNYAQAKQFYEEAAKLKPNEALPAQKIAMAQQALEREEKEKAEREKVNKSYQEALAAGQQAMQKGEHKAAQQHFRTAASFKPKEELPRELIAKSQRQEEAIRQNALKQERAELEQKYDEAIQKGDGHLKQKEYPQAIDSYNQALQIKPSDTYAQAQVKKTKNLEVEDEQMKQVEVEQKYEQFIAEGDAQKQAQEFASAITAYKQALELKPSDPAAGARLTESKKLLEDQRQKEKEEREQKATFNALVKEADDLFKTKEYVKAKIKYQKALSIYSTEVYPKNQISAIENILTSNEKEKEYNQLIAEAEKLFDQKSWDEAISQYTQAQLIYPQETLPRKKINEISRMKSTETLQQINKEYEQLIVQAEQKTKEEKYQEAKSFYNQAQLLIPEKKLPRKRINEINEILSRKSQKEIEDNFNNLLAQAEEQVKLEKYDEAKNYLELAKQVLPESPEPQKRINEINLIVSKNKRNKTEEEFNQIVQKAESYVVQQDFEAAKSTYLLASKVMPESPYPQQRINEINKMINSREKNKKKEKYNQLIQQADNLFSQKKYLEARGFYTTAQKEEPGNPYPLQRINEIKSILTELTRIEKEKQEIKAEYDKVINLANKFFSEETYLLAKEEYKKALNIFPDEQYPVGQIKKIEEILAGKQRLEAERKATEEGYSSSITQANQLFKQKNYLEAKPYYERALTQKPGDVHASSQIKRIEQIMERQMAEKQRLAQIEEKYKRITKEANEKFVGKDYKQAKALYLSALEVKPNEEYPRVRIKEAEEMLRLLAAARTGSKSTATKKTTSSGELAELNLKNTSEREKYLNSLRGRYKKGITIETYKKGNKTTKRYIVVRDGGIHEYRVVKYTWGGSEYSADGKPSNYLYVRDQTRPRDGEAVFEVDK